MIPTRPFTIALRTLLATATALPVGPGHAPDGPPPYYLLHFIDRQTHGAPISDLNEDCTLVYQVDSVSGPDPRRPDSHGTQDQMEWLADKAREAILGRDPATGLWLHPLTVPGIKVMGRAPGAEAGGTPDAADGIMSSSSRYVFELTSV
ncbi:hypothetical protein [Streptomyces sp. NPDC059916]|uniref:hypothetical protein n=1 Tax=Streptomyces sp. NPDC059916 TaxID=3347001 RepID=UPI0036A45BFB